MPCKQKQKERLSRLKSEAADEFLCGAVSRDIRDGQSGDVYRAWRPREISLAGLRRGEPGVKAFFHDRDGGGAFVDEEEVSVVFCGGFSGGAAAGEEV